MPIRRSAVAVACLVLASACSSSVPTAPEAPPNTPGVALAITAHPQSQSVSSGSQATLAVTAVGSGPLRFQWLTETAGSGSGTPVPGATTSTFTTPALTSNSTYWVRVSDDVASIESSRATISVTAGPPAPPPPPAATAPGIIDGPRDVTISSGERATLRVSAGGASPLTYQWYAGSSGSTTSPLGGATASEFTTPTLSSTSSYWVRVSNAMGSADSATATVTVAPPAPPSGTAPAITGQPQHVTVSSGERATFTVSATGTGPLSYQWYTGSSGQTGGAIPGSTSPTHVTPALLVSQTFWVRVSNAFGSADSITVSVTVSGGAPPPPPPSGGANPGWEDEVVTLVNQRRAAGATCGGTSYPSAPALVMNAALRAAARGHSEDMATQNYFSHTSLDGRTFSQRMSNAGYSGAFPWGENIAAGQSSPAAVVNAWMNTAGHCANIMNASYRAIGVGYAFRAGSTYGHYWTQNFGGS